MMRALILAIPVAAAGLAPALASAQDTTFEDTPPGVAPKYFDHPFRLSGDQAAAIAEGEG